MFNIRVCFPHRSRWHTIEWFMSHLSPKSVAKKLSCMKDLQICWLSSVLSSPGPCWPNGSHVWPKSYDVPKHMLRVQAHRRKPWSINKTSMPSAFVALLLTPNNCKCRLLKRLYCNSNSSFNKHFQGPVCPFFRTMSPSHVVYFARQHPQPSLQRHWTCSRCRDLLRRRSEKNNDLGVNLELQIDR